MPGSIQDQFEAAVKLIRGLPASGPFQPSHEMKLCLYGHYKQATQGECRDPAPSALWNPVAKAKWNAWHRLGAMGREQAMEAYVHQIKQVIETMSLTDDVGAVMDQIGPLYEFVDLPTPATPTSSSSSSSLSSTYTGEPSPIPATTAIPTTATAIPATADLSCSDMSNNSNTQRQQQQPQQQRRRSRVRFCDQRQVNGADVGGAAADVGGAAADVGGAAAESEWRHQPADAESAGSAEQIKSSTATSAAVAAAAVTAATVFSDTDDDEEFNDTVEEPHQHAALYKTEFVTQSAEYGSCSTDRLQMLQRKVDTMLTMMDRSVSDSQVDIVGGGSGGDLCGATTAANSAADGAVNCCEVHSELLCLARAIRQSVSAMSDRLDRLERAMLSSQSATLPPTLPQQSQSAVTSRRRPWWRFPELTPAQVALLLMAWPALVHVLLRTLVAFRRRRRG